MSSSNNQKREMDILFDLAELKEVCVFERGQGRGYFLTHIFEAFLVADKDNTQLMYALMKTLQKKYHLKKERV